jgi:hypothetical protein
MKKIYILALGLITLSSAFAQSPYERQQGYPNNDNRNDGYARTNKGEAYNNRSDGYNSPSTINKGNVYTGDYDRSNRDYDRSDSRFGRRYNEQYSFTLRERDARIYQVNREYENKVNYIIYNRFMSNSSKRWELRKLENQREQQLRMVLARFNDNRNKWNDRYYDKSFNWRN